MVGPAGLSPRAALAGLISGEGAAGIIVRDIRLPRTLLAVLIGGTLGLSGAALQGLLRNPLAEPALFGAPQAAAAAAAFVIAFGFAGAISLAVPLAGIAGALVSIGSLVAIAGRRASLTVTLLAGLALASFAGAMTALVLNLARSEPALFGAPQAAAAAAAFVIAFGFAGAISLAVPLAGIAGALVSIGSLVAIAGRRASLTVTLLAGLALASFAGAMTALVLNLA